MQRSYWIGTSKMSVFSFTCAPSSLPSPFRPSSHNLLLILGTSLLVFLFHSVHILPPWKRRTLTVQMVGELAQNGLHYAPHPSSTSRPDKIVATSSPIATGREEADGESDGADEDEPLFSLEGFIPLLQERIYVVASTARMHLLSWIDVRLLIPSPHAPLAVPIAWYA